MNTKITFFNFLPYECEAAEEYLNDMAKKGWVLKSINGPVLTFKKDGFNNLKYSVDILHEVSEFDSRDSAVALEYREYCEAAGWEFVGQRGKVQIFCTERTSETLEIHTDEKEKFKSVFKASLYIALPQLFAVLLWCFNLYMQLSNNTEYTLATGLGFLNVFSVISFVLIEVVEIISLSVWAIKTNRNLNQGNKIRYNNYKQVQIKRILFWVYGLFILVALVILNKGEISNPVLLLTIFAPIMIIIVIRIFINKRKYSRDVNMVITFVSLFTSVFLINAIVTDEISSKLIERNTNKQEEAFKLQLTDFGYEKGDNSKLYSEQDKSILAQKVIYFSNDKEHEFSYIMFQSKYPWIVKFDSDMLIKRFNKIGFDVKHYNSNLPEDIRSYKYNETNAFILVSKDKVVDIKNNFKDMDNDEFLNIVYNKLFKE